MNQSLKTLSLSAILSVCVFATVQAQEGIRFNSQGEFKAVLAESAKTGKLIFMDCYTSWCAPCKWMEKNVFVNDTVAAFYNARFVNYKMDMEKGEGPALNKRYGVKVYPTYLFLNGKGEVVHKATSRMEADKFMDEARKALDPKRSFTALEKKFNDGNRSNEVLLEYAIALQHFNRQKADSVGQLLIAQLKDQDLLTETGWRTIQQFTWSETDRLGAYLCSTAMPTPKNSGGASEENARKTDFVRTVRPDPEKGLHGILYTAGALETVAGAGAAEEGFSARGGVLPDQREHRRLCETDRQRPGRPDEERRHGAQLHSPEKQLHRRQKQPVLEQAYKMAKRAAEINPEEYSNQSTYAKACQDMGYKEEALKAAEKTYQLALKETSKIQGLAQKLLDEIKAM